LRKGLADRGELIQLIKEQNNQLTELQAAKKKFEHRIAELEGKIKTKMVFPLRSQFSLSLLSPSRR
jgi:phage shock protein A